ncbi:hypothetical protein J4414_02160 [Candidatus Woesearchaeota archaeon]|nr:hypothetical protein [Candidatus Woesearchaeota archaeon]
MDYNQNTIAVLRRLFTKRRIGGKHTEEKNVLRWLKNLSPEDKNLALKDWDKAIKDGLVLKQKKTKEWHVSLNPRRLKDIHNLIK